MEVSNILLKFGQKKHLEMLASGKLFFNPVKKYREDTTYYRGDVDEGCTPINPQKIKIIDNHGNNIFDKLSIPDTVRQHISGDEGLLMFCSSHITDNILEFKDDRYFLSNEYKSAIKEFGNYVILFLKNELIQRLHETIKESDIGYIADSITYKDLSDFQSKENNSSNIYSFYNPYFKKDIKYNMQNEYRIILDNINNKVAVSNDGCCILNIGKLEWAHIYETEEFLNEFYIIEDEQKNN